MKQGLFGRLGFQGLATSFRSFGQNWSYGRGIFSRVTVGAGPVNLTFGDGQFPLQWQENLGNIAFNTVGLANLVTGGSVYFNKQHLALGYSGGLIAKIAGTSAWSGAYAILGGAEALNEAPYFDLSHELHHIWQSRAFVNSFLYNWLASGFQSVLSGRSFKGPDSFNYYEQQAYGFYWWR